MSTLTPEPISPLVVGVLGQMTKDAHHITQSLIGMLQPDADRYRILRDAIRAFADAQDSKRLEEKLLHLMHWVDDLTAEEARAAIESGGVGYGSVDYYTAARQHKGGWIGGAE